MAHILTITANPLLDFLSPEQLLPGRVTRSSGFSAMAAGKGINVGRILHRHGHQVTSAFFAGGPTGDLLTELVAADGVAVLRVPTAARMRLGLICAGNSEQPQGSLLENGFAVEAAEAKELVHRVCALIPKQDLVIISGSVPQPTIAWIYPAIADACADHAVACWIDSYGVGMDQALQGAHPPRLSKPNRQEYAASQDWQHCPELHITDGPQRSEIRSPEGRWELIPPPVQEVNPVGSGDCYLAGLAHARLSNLPFTEQLAYAAACGAANAARWDVAGIGPEDAQALVAQAQVRPLS